MGKFMRVLIVGCLLLLVHSGFAAEVTLADVKRLEQTGDFKKATVLLVELSKNKNLSEPLRREYQWENEWMARTLQDYSFSEESLYQKLLVAVKGLTRSEFDGWLKEHRFDGRMIDGQLRYVGTSVSNLFWRHPDLEERRQPVKDVAEYHQKWLNITRRIKTAAAEEKKTFVFPTHFKCSMKVTAAKDTVKKGEMIRAWLPIPRSYPFQTEFHLRGSSSPVKYLSQEDSPIRSVYLEQTAVKNEPTKFQVDYEYVRYGIYFDLEPEGVNLKELEPGVKKFTEEAPHVVFTPKIKALAKQIAGEEENPLLQAKAFYNWITENIKYSYAREYSTLTNISDYCCSNGYGDCGQEGLLFITLCRSKGIPARWQSGWNLFPGHKGIHDWTEIYLAPYGWVPVDPWAGIYSIRYCTNLSDEERHELRDFYFGGLDQYRMSANADHSQEIQPPKKSFRSDDVDFQRGELEGIKNIYFDEYDYELKVEEISSVK